MVLLTDGPGQSVEAATDVVAQRIQDEVVLVNLRTNRIYVLNRTAARFWDLMDAGNDRAKIRERLLDEFDVEGAQLDEQIEALLSDLTAEELVSVRDRA